MWALGFLVARGAADLTRSYEELWRAAWLDYERAPDTGENVPSWFLGNSSLLLFSMLRGPKTHRSEAAQRLKNVITANAENPTWEILWGSPGTMLAALFAFEATKDLTWLHLYRESAAKLLEKWTYHPDLGCHLWTQDLYQKVHEYYGAGHGFAGNVFPLLRGLEHLKPEEQSMVLARVADTTKRLAVRADGLANWAPARDLNAKAVKMLVQWCHGAPGFLLAIASRYPIDLDPELDQLFLDAGELVWTAGPLAKGACFCHGTDGNGMALLTLYKRTGDQMWLERTRAFAMTALQQSRDHLATYGRRRYTLWTGDLGLAVFLQAVLDKEPHMPALDFV